MNILTACYFLVSVVIIRDTVPSIAFLSYEINFKESVDKSNKFGALLINMFKANQCIDHELSIANLFWYGLPPFHLGVTLILICSYLSNRTQQVKIKASYSDRCNTYYEAPQGSILGPLLFNIYIIYLFFELDVSRIASYANDTTPYSCAKDIPSVVMQLQ